MESSCSCTGERELLTLYRLFSTEDACHGVGAEKLARYGKVFLAALNATENPSGVSGE